MGVSRYGTRDVTALTPGISVLLEGTSNLGVKVSVEEVVVRIRKAEWRP